MKNGIIMLAVMALVGLLALSPAMAGEKSHSKSGDESHMGSQHMRSQMDADSHRYFSKKAVRGTDLIGKGVFNRDNEEIGSVNDIVIGKDGRVNYLIVEYGGVMGMGDRLAPIPLSAVDRSYDNDNNLRINVSKEELDNAPNFADNAWPDFNDDSYQDRLRGYYGGVPPTPTHSYDEMETMQGGKSGMHDTDEQTGSKSMME